jgi:Spy/CpxP family protein refolding chaperone
MKTYLTRFAAVAALAAGMAFAQAPAPAAPPPVPATTAKSPRAVLRHRMLKALNLTAAQKQQAKAIFQQTKQNVQPVAQQARQNREALAAAVKANDTAQIHNLSAQQGSLEGQVLAMRSESMAKFYATLTPDQRAKAEQIQQKMQQLKQQRKAVFQG